MVKLPKEMQALLYMSTYLAQYKRGWSHTAMYILRDRTDENPELTYGFYGPDYTPRLAADYLHNFTTILADNKSIVLRVVCLMALPISPKPYMICCSRKVTVIFLLSSGASVLKEVQIISG